MWLFCKKKNDRATLRCPRLRVGTNDRFTWAYYITPSNILLNGNIQLQKKLISKLTKKRGCQGSPSYHLHLYSPQFEPLVMVQIILLHFIYFYLFYLPPFISSISLCLARRRWCNGGWGQKYKTKLLKVLVLILVALPHYENCLFCQNK